MPEDGAADRAAKCKYYARIFVAHLFSHVGLCGLVVGYAIVGALTFEALESRHELSQRTKIRTHRKDCLRDLWTITEDFNVLYEHNWTSAVALRLKEFEMSVVEAVKNEGYDGKETENSDLQWSFSGALLYCITVITTIGYGNIAPKTDIGKVVTIFYALMGIPLMLLCLTNIGNLFAHAFKFSYSRVCCRLFRENTGSQHYRHSTRVRKDDNQISAVQAFESNKDIAEKTPLTSVDIVMDTTRHHKDGTEETPDVQLKTPEEPQKQPLEKDNGNCNMDEDKLSNGDKSPTSTSPPMTPVYAEVNSVSSKQDEMITMETTFQEDKYTMEDRVPITMVLLLVMGYICGGATIFSLWENWSFLNGAYFCFITLSTIGFGDLVPGTAIFDTGAEAGQAKLIICCFYLILGLSIIAMSFNLVQEEVILKCKNIARNLGILGSENNDD